MGHIRDWRRRAAELGRVETTLSWCWLDVPSEDQLEAQMLGAHWDDFELRWWADDRLGFERFERWFPPLPEAGDASQADVTQIVLLGMMTTCWRCGDVSTALAGMTEVGADRLLDRVPCHSSSALRLASSTLPDEIRERWRVNVARRRASKTSGRTYLSNGCGSCDAQFGNATLYGQSIPNAIAALGSHAFHALATVDVPTSKWNELQASSVRLDRRTDAGA